MPNKKLTDAEIIKALECCGKNPPSCADCGYKGKCNRRDCYDYLKFDALDLINRQEEENNELQLKIASCNSKIEALQMDNAQLQSDIINANQNFDHIKELWETEKEKVAKAKHKVVDVCKELQTAKAEIERLKEKSIEDDKLLNDRVTEAVNTVNKANQKYVDALEEALKEKATEIEAFKDQEERANNHCKNVCEPKYKAEIDRKKEKISRLQSMLIRFLNEMIEWSNKNNIDTTNFFTIPILESEKENLVKQIKAEAYKEFAELLHCQCESIINQPHNENVRPISWKVAYEEFDEKIDNLLKEMVGEDNG